MAEMASFLPIVSTVLQTAAPIIGGINQNRAAQSAADQLDAQANAEMATAQRAAIEQRRQAMLANSRLQAVAQGGGSDQTVVNLAADIAGEGEYRALTALYEGEDRAASLRYGAEVKRFEGKQAKAAGMLEGVTTVLGKSKTLFDAYGAGGPDKYAETIKHSRTGYDIRSRR